MQCKQMAQTGLKSVHIIIHYMYIPPIFQEAKDSKYGSSLLSTYQRYEAG